MRERTLIIRLVILLLGIIFIIRLTNLQLFNATYAKKAEDNIMKEKVLYPYRGLIYDRKGKLLVYNQPEFDLMVIPGEARNNDIKYFCKIFNISEEEYETRMKAARDHDWWKPSIFIDRLSEDEFARVQGELVHFEGFTIQTFVV